MTAWVDQIKETIPDYAKDTRLNIDAVIKRSSLPIEEAEAVAQYGSADAGASLGDILGAALASSGSKGKAKAAPAAKGDTKSLDARGRLTGPQGGADDLKKIKGVGPAFEKKLNEAGVFHFWQIAALSEDQVSNLEEELAFQGRMERDDWKGQSEALMSEG